MLQRHGADEACARAACRALQLLLCDDAARSKLTGARTVKFRAEGKVSAFSGSTGAGSSVAAAATAAASGFDPASIPQLTALAAQHGDLNVLVLGGKANLVMPASAISLREMEIMAAGKLGGDGMMPALVSALRRHARNADLAAAACALIALLAEHDINRVELVKAGALAAVVGAAPFHTAGEGDEGRVLPTLCLALEKLTEKAAE